MQVLSLKTRRPGSVAPALLDALLRADDQLAMELVLDVLDEVRSRTALFADLIHPVQVEAANLWYRGEATAADEVRVAIALRRIVGRLGPTPAARTVRSGARCVIAMPHGDAHDLGLLMLTLALQDHGWTTEVMGPLHGLGDIASLVTARPPRLFCLSAGDLPPLPEVRQAISAIHRVRVPVLVGGVAFNRRPDLWREVGADAHGPDVRVGVVLAQRLAGR